MSLEVGQAVGQGVARRDRHVGPGREQGLGAGAGREGGRVGRVGRVGEERGGGGEGDREWAVLVLVLLRNELLLLIQW